MDSPELFSYHPKTITSIGAKVYLDDKPVIDTTCHSIALTKKGFLIHDFNMKGCSNHKIYYLNEQNVIHESVTKDIGIVSYEYAFLLDEKKMIYYNTYSLNLFEYESTILLKSYAGLYFRLDDSQNIIILEDYGYADQINMEFKITTLRKDSNYKHSDTRKYHTKISPDHVDYRSWNYGNLLFITELNAHILNYYQHQHNHHIILVKYDDKNKYYDVLVYLKARDQVEVDRWNQKSSNEWFRTVIHPMIGRHHFYLLNQHFDRQIITNYCCSEYNFGSAVIETYSDWQKRMLEILKEAIKKISTDLLKIIVSMC